MATEIKFCPIVKGDDAIRFNESIVKSSANSVPQKEQSRIKKLVKEVLKSQKL